MKQKLPIRIRRKLRSRFPGIFRSIYTTFRGLDNVSFREYVPGEDPPIAINVRLSQIKNKLLVVLKEAPKGLTCYLVVDCSPSMGYATTSPTKWELAEDFIIGLAEDLKEAGSQIGLLLFSNEEKGVIHSLKPGSYSIEKLIRAIREFKPEKYSKPRKINQKATSLVKPLIFLAGSIRNSSLIVILTDGYFNDVEAYEKILARLKTQGFRRHGIVSIILRDRREEKMPRLWLGQVHKEDMETGEVIAGNTVAPDTSFAEACERCAIFHETFINTDSGFELEQKLYNLFERHADRRSE